MTKREKALWLHEHYKNYSLKWYLENDARLNAMFRKVYHRYMTDLNARASKAQLSHIEDLGRRMREVYESKGASYPFYVGSSASLGGGSYG